MESDTRHGPDEKEAIEGLDTRVNITVTSYRTRKHDTDGISVKAVLDGLVRVGILREDSCEEVAEISFKSEIAKEEKTVIEIKEIKEHYKQEVKRLENEQ